MKSSLRGVLSLLVIGLSMAASHSWALAIRFDPVVSTANVGQLLGIDVWVDDVDPTLGIGAYDFTVQFDPSVVAVNSTAALAPLGFSTGQLVTTAPGSVAFAEVSFEAPGDLLALQTGSFRLASLVFDALGVGTTTLSFVGMVFADVYSNILAVDSATALINVTALPVGVPEPGTVLLLGLGIFAIAFALLRKRNRR